MTEQQTMAKAHLNQYQNMQRNIRHMKEGIDELDSRINSTTSTPKDVQVQTSGGTPKDELICILADRRSDYLQAQITAENICGQIEIIISNIECDIFRRILRNRFVYGKSFEQISIDEGYCVRYIIALYLLALTDYSMFVNSALNSTN